MRNPGPGQGLRAWHGMPSASSGKERRAAGAFGVLSLSDGPRKDGEAARQGRAPHKDEPVRADPRDAGSHALHGQGAEPGRRHLRRSGWARAPGWEIRLRCDRPVRAGPGVRGPACSRTPGPSPALKPPLAGLILAPATPG